MFKLLRIYRENQLFSSSISVLPYFFNLIFQVFVTLTASNFVKKLFKERIIKQHHLCKICKFKHKLLQRILKRVRIEERKNRGRKGKLKFWEYYINIKRNLFLLFSQFLVLFGPSPILICAKARLSFLQRRTDIVLSFILILKLKVNWFLYIKNINFVCKNLQM